MLNTLLLFLIWICRKIAKLFGTKRTETLFVIPQYNATNYVLTAYGITDIGFMETMNFGRDDPDYEKGEKRILIGDSYSLATRLSLQHYHRIATGGELNLSLDGLNVLEVGCGRGGGSQFIAEKLAPALLTAVDLSPQGIDVCKKKYKHTPNLKFRVADAQKLPFSNSFFDIVLNVESSHCYPNFMAFIKEVHRVLKPGGKFCYADFSTSETISQLEQIFPKIGLEIISKENVAKQAIASLDKVARLRTASVKKFPFYIRPILRNFVGTQDGVSYKNLRSGEWTYIRFTCICKKKKGSEA